MHELLKEKLTQLQDHIENGEQGAYPLSKDKLFQNEIAFNHLQIDALAHIAAGKFKTTNDILNRYILAGDALVSELHLVGYITSKDGKLKLTDIGKTIVDANAHVISW